MKQLLIILTLAILGAIAAYYVLTPAPAVASIQSVTSPLRRADPAAWGLAPGDTEVIEKRTQDSKTFKRTDGPGRFTTFFGKDIHYESRPGTWAETKREFVSDAMVENGYYNSRINASGIDVTNPQTGKGVRWYTPARPSAVGRKANYSGNGLSWAYTNSRWGVKLEATVAVKRGPQTYVFTYAMLGGAPDFTIDAAGGAISDGFTIPRAVVRGANRITYPTSAWALLAGPRIAFSFDDSLLPPEAYPYVIDPTTTFDIATSTDDANAYSNNQTTYPPIFDGCNTIDNTYDTSRHKSGSNYSLNIGLVRWDTGSIPDGATIDSATLTLHIVGKQDANSRSLVADWNAWVSCDSADFNSTAGTDAHGGTTIASLTTGTTNTFTLTNVSNVSTTGYTQIRFNVSGGEPTGLNSFEWATLDHVSLPEPRLSVTYTDASAAITGTAEPSLTEQEVRTGGETIIITLTGATWNAAGSAFDNQRQAIINGLSSAQSETRGWNNLVRGVIPVSDVVRTSSTVVTITLSASVGYSVTSNDVVTVTVPGAAHSGGSAIIATPTFFVAAGLETLTIGGTLGGSGGVPSEIRVGNETITYTVSGARVQAAGSTFDAARQGVLTNIDSAQADQNGWDALRATLPVTGVVRTSNSVVTVTLAPLSAYAIPSTETLTATLPASGAVVFPGILTGTPTFNIVPAFVSSGNRVTAAINLSAITAVAYCAIGWEATTPASTTITVETSVNNGTTYSSATNGSCPSGISLGSSLSTITQFRIRANLSTTASASTPTLDALVLIIVDRTGHALHYELNTTPGITIEDRSDNTNDGTLSFPVPSSVITSTTGDITTTRDRASNTQVLSPIDVTSPVTGAANQANLFQQAEEGFSDLPFYDLIRAMASAGDTLPIRFVWTVFLGMMILLLGVVVLHLTTSLFAAVVAMGMGIVIVGTIGNGLIPTWIIFPYIAIAGGLMLLRPRLQT